MFKEKTKQPVESGRVIKLCLVLAAMNLGLRTWALEAMKTSESLFNGTNLDGWVTMNGGDFTANNGVIHLEGGNGWLRTKREYANFILTAEWRGLSSNYNSGIFVRAPLEGDPWATNIWQINTKRTGIGELLHGSTKVIPSAIPPAPAGSWVTFRIEARGTDLALAVNGQPAFEFHALEPAAGYIGLQAEGKAFEFRNLKISEIGPEAQPSTTPAGILKEMQRVADWQLANPSTVPTTDWIQAAGEAGFVALTGISGDPKYRGAMLAMGETNHWRLGPRKFHADDQCVGQTYAELYLLYRDPQMIVPMRLRFDDILAHPSSTTSLDFSQRDHGQDLWSWCDSLFMGPPTWLRLYAATDDTRYLNFAVTNWWRTTDYLYDKEEHLFFRDSTYFKRTEANGQKVFWSRGNGWVMAGLVRMLQYLPTNHPDCPRFEQLFQDMAHKILSCQQPDGLWRASLLDPQSYPLKEASGSGFYTYALAWGINQGLLDPTIFEPAVLRGWAALVDCVNADGKLAHVQPVGSDPRNFSPDATAPYGVGAFLLAGSEVYRMAVFHKLQEVTPGASPARSLRYCAVKITNPSDFRRDCETVEVSLGDGYYSNNLPAKVFDTIGGPAVMDGVSARILDSQIYAESNNAPAKLLFQVDLAPGETRTFYLVDAMALGGIPAPILKTFARMVPERHDDFAWESDRIAHRMFGKALETWQEEPLTSSGMDVWIKRTRNLVVNDMYHTGKYFDTRGLSQDDYRVGKTRGCGGLGVWQDNQLYVSKNWRTSRIITSGPIRSEFELTYDAWDADGRKVSETKRISIDAGSNLSRVESTFTSDDSSPLQIAVGLAERPGENVVVTNGSAEIETWTTSVAHGLVVQDQTEGTLTYWQPKDFAKGTTAVAIVLPKDSVEAFTNDKPNLPQSALEAPTNTVTEGQPATRNLLAISHAEIGKPFSYYVGAGWDQSGDFPDAASWNVYVQHFAERRDHPLQVAIGN